MRLASTFCMASFSPTFVAFRSVSVALMDAWPSNALTWWMDLACHKEVQNQRQQRRRVSRGGS